jgi:WD40 repeat protein
VAIGRVGGRVVIVSGGGDGKVRVWDALTSRLAAVLLASHDNPVNAVAIGRVEGHVVIVSGSQDRTVMLREFAAESRRNSREAEVANRRNSSR